MKSTLVHVATDLAAAGAFNPADSTGRLRALFGGLIVVALIFVSLMALVKHGRKGDASGAGRVAGTVLLCLIPAVLAGIGAIAWFTGFLSWLIPSLG